MLQIRVMTDKDWYVIHQTRKLGPFAKQQILEMLKTGSVMRSQKIWKQGLEQPITSYDLFLESIGAKPGREKPKPGHQPITQDESPKVAVEQVTVEEDFDDELPPPLPPLPKIEAKINTETEAEAKTKTEENEVIPEQVEEVILKEDEPEEIVIHKEIADFKRLSGQEVAVLPPLPPDIIRQKNKKKNLEKLFQKALIFVAAICLAVLGYVFFHDIYIVHIQSAARPNIVDVKDYKVLKKAASQSASKLAVGLMSSKDASSLILATNFVYDADIKISLSSIKDKVLFKDPVVAKANGSLSAGQAVFKKLNFESGDMIYPGYYNVKIESSDEFRNLFWYDKFYKIPQKIVMEDLSIFLGHLPLIKFKKELKRFLVKRARRERQFEGDLKQKWATLGGIVNQLKAELVQMVQAPSAIWKTKVSSFEQKYTKIFGSFFTEFYLNNEEVQKKLLKSNVRELDEFNALYDELSSIAKSVGRKTVQIIERASAFNYAPNEKTRADMISQVNKFTAAFTTRIEKGTEELNRVLESEQKMDDSEPEDQ